MMNDKMETKRNIYGPHCPLRIALKQCQGWQYNFSGFNARFSLFIQMNIIYVMAQRKYGIKGEYRPWRMATNKQENKNEIQRK